MFPGTPQITLRFLVAMSKDRATSRPWDYQLTERVIDGCNNRPTLQMDGRKFREVPRKKSDNIKTSFPVSHFV